MRPEEANHCPPVAERTFPPRRLLDSHRRMSTPWDEWRLWASVELEMPPPTTRQSYRCPTSRHGDHLWVSTTVAPMLHRLSARQGSRAGGRVRRPTTSARSPAPDAVAARDGRGGRRRRRTTKEEDDKGGDDGGEIMGGAN